MLYLFELNHPKHYHQFKYIFKIIESNRDSFIVLARDKDVLLSLLKEDNIPFEIYGKRGNNLFSKLIFVPKILFKYWGIIRKSKPNVIISKASPYAAIIGKLFRIPTVITPDSEVVNLTNKIVVPLSTLVITQKTYKNEFGKKHKRINGFFETTYLHPNYFISEEIDVFKESTESKQKKYFVLRFIGWDANHDINQFGFSDEEKIKLVDFLLGYGKVIITSEKNLPNSLKKYVMSQHPSQIHHLLSFASIYIGDSQSMATEACLLGTPSIRYNSFVGENDMSNFKILQEKYELLYNCKNFEEVIYYAKRVIEDDNSKIKWRQNSNNYFKEIGDTNKEIFNIIKTVAV
ncbi:MAG: DUF354 domain-containing protein [Bacteroidetes bacterium]|nr:DUF354 domain-containing protein [Bacteroidota bacterium]